MEENASENWSPLPHQVLPSGDWRCFVIKGKRGIGKTRGGLEAAHQFAMSCPGSTGVIGGAEWSFVREILVEQMLAIHPEVEYQPSARLLRWPNGSLAILVDENTPLGAYRVNWFFIDEVGLFRSSSFLRELNDRLKDATDWKARGVIAYSPPKFLEVAEELWGVR